MPRITQSIQQERLELMKTVLKCFALNGFEDQSEISYMNGSEAFEALTRMKDAIVRIYPKRNTNRLRKGIKKRDLDSIRVLREMLRYYGMSLISKRKQTKDGCVYKYKILRA